MENLIIILNLFTITIAYSQKPLQTNDSNTSHLERWEFSGLVLVTDNAFAPIPAFSFQGPAVMAFLSAKKAKLKYEPDFSIGLNGKPWMWNNWVKYEFVKKQSLSLNLGINPSLFFHSSKSDNGVELIETHRNLTGELSGIWAKLIHISICSHTGTTMPLMRAVNGHLLISQ